MQGKTLIQKAEEQLSQITVRDLEDTNVINVQSSAEFIRLLKTYGKCMDLEPAIMMPDQTKIICFGRI